MQYGKNTAFVIRIPIVLFLEVDMEQAQYGTVLVIRPEGTIAKQSELDEFDQALQEAFA